MRNSLSVILMITLVGVSASAPAALVNRWVFEEPNGTAAPQVLDSVSGNHGTFSSMNDTNRSTDLPTNAQSFNSTRSLSFGGGASNDAVVLNSQIVLATSANWSVSTWYKGSDFGGNGPWGAVLLGRDNNDIFGNFVINQGKAAYVHYAGGWQSLSSTTTVNDNQWHLLTLVHFGNANAALATAQIWVDGKLEASGSAAIDVPSFPYRIDNMMLGFSGRYTQGILDDARVYNHSLSNLEIKELLPEPGAFSLLACGGLLVLRRKVRRS